MHGVAGSATTHFLDDRMAEPLLSRLHKAVETATKAAEASLNDRLLVSAKLLCYHAGELLASSRLDCTGFEPEEIGLDTRLCRIFLQEAEDLVLCTEAVISELRRARLALSGLFKWFKALHATVIMHKDPDSNEISNNLFNLKFKVRDQQDIGSFLNTEKLLESLSYSSNTEAILNFEVTRLLSDLTPCPIKTPIVTFGTQNIKNLTPEAIADQIRSCVEKQQAAETATASPHASPILGHDRKDDLSNSQLAGVHANLKAVGVAMNAIFAGTRSALAKKVKYQSSAQFPAERLQEVQLQDRVSFRAHLPNPRILKPQDVFAHSDCLEDISALIQSTPTTLWLLKSLHHDSIRMWLGLKSPINTSIIQASFYANEQGNYCKNSHHIAVLARGPSSLDEIWLVDDASLLKEFGAEQNEPRSEAACFVKEMADWSHHVYSSAPTKDLQLDKIKILSLVHACSRRLFVSGCRGVACVLAEPNFLTLYDLEDFDSDIEDVER